MKRNPNIYAAGKMTRDDWRQILVPGMKKNSWTDAPVVLTNFNYLGPFSVGCGHGCYPEPNLHQSVAGCCSGVNEVRSDIVTKCLNAVDRSDLVFCYIERLDCHGTIVEITRAHTKGIPVVIAFAPGVAELQNNEMWFPTMLASTIVFGVSRCQLLYVLNKSIKELAW